MADSVVTLPLLEQVTVLNQELVSLDNFGGDGFTNNFSDDVRYIISELKTNQAVLRDYDNRSEVNEWVTELRHVTFDIEDVLEEYMFQFHNQQSPAVQGHGTCGFIHKIKQLFNKYVMRWCNLDRRNLDRRIHNVKMKTEIISQARDRYGLVDHSIQASMTTETSIVHDRRDDVLFLEETNLVGIDEPRKQLIRWLVDKPTESRLGVVSVLGPGGLGKTTLVKMVYDSEEVKQQFSIHCWITISRNYDTKHLLRELIIATGKYEERKGLLSELDNMSAMQLKQMLSINYQSKRYIIVMDDMEDLGAWNEISSALPDSGCGSRIIVTTRSRDVATSCQGEYGIVYELKPLSSEDSWTLFQKIAFKYLNVNDYSTQHLREVGEKILEKCGGLPLAIAAIAGLLSTKKTTEWDRICTDIESQFHHSELNGLDKILSLSYNDLSYHLKFCLLYTCLFPEDYAIKCSRLLRLFVAEGFIETDSGNLRKEDKAKSYLDELIDRSLIQEQDIDGSGKVRTCSIHDLIRTYILKKARDQNFAECFENWSPDIKPYTERGRRLSIFPNEDVEEYSFRKGKWFLFQIQSFFAYGKRSLFNSSTVSIFLSGKIQFLKVLDLEGTHLDEFPGEALSNLVFLRYLGLNAERLSLPSSLGRLVNLETLVLKGSLFFQLPVEILHLKRLRNLVGDFLQLPKGVGQLTTLEKLCTVVGYEGIDEELGKLTQLRSLDILLKKDENEHIPNSVQKMEHLRSLRLRMSDPKENTLLVGNLTSLPPVLERITLIGLMRVTPDGILRLTKLTKLRLAFSGLQGNSFFEGLQMLSDLCELVLEMNAINVAELHFRHKGFSNLRTLKLHGLTELRRIKVEEGAMPLIRHICFCDCQQLENVPVGIEHLTTLKHVDWFGMPTGSEDTIRSFCWKDGHSPIINVNQLFDKFALAD